MTQTKSDKGLAGIVVAESGLSYIDGESGRLWYRGYDIHALAKHAASVTEGSRSGRHAVVLLVVQGPLAEGRRAVLLVVHFQASALRGTVELVQLFLAVQHSLVLVADGPVRDELVATCYARRRGRCGRVRAT